MPEHAYIIEDRGSFIAVISFSSPSPIACKMASYRVFPTHGEARGWLDEMEQAESDSLLLPVPGVTDVSV